MRRYLCAVLLSCILGIGSLMAADLSVSQVQQLVNAAQTAVAGGPAVKVSITIGGKDVVFTVTRDAVGNVTARPEPGPDSAGVAISQATIQMKVDAKGVLLPNSMVVVASNQAITSYSLQLNPDGTIASIYQAGGAGGAGGPSQPTPVVGGIGGSVAAGNVNSLPQNIFPDFTSGNLHLPAGAESRSRAASGSQP